MNAIILEVDNPDKESLLLALLAELDFLRVVESATATNSSSTMTVEEPDVAPWAGHELELTPASSASVGSCSMRLCR